MTLKKLDELIDQAKKSIYKRINANPREIEGAESYFKGYFMMSLFYELFKDSTKSNKAFNKWQEVTNELRTLKYQKDYSDIVKQFLNRR